MVYILPHCLVNKAIVHNDNSMKMILPENADITKMFAHPHFHQVGSANPPSPQTSASPNMCFCVCAALRWKLLSAYIWRLIPLQ